MHVSRGGVCNVVPTLPCCPIHTILMPGAQNPRVPTRPGNPVRFKRDTPALSNWGHQWPLKATLNTERRQQSSKKTQRTKKPYPILSNLCYFPVLAKHLL